MSWTPTITERRNDVTQWALEITYTHPEKKTIVKGYKVTGLLTDEMIKRIARSEIAQLESVAVVAELTLDKGAVVDLAEPVAEKKAPALAAREEWQKNYGELQRLRRAAAEGFIAADDPRIAAFSITLKSAWLPEYEDLL